LCQGEFEHEPTIGAPGSVGESDPAWYVMVKLPRARTAHPFTFAGLESSQ
jgi:hypothetical protein